MASGGSDEISADESPGMRYRKFQCAYVHPPSSSTCDSDSVPNTDKSDNDAPKTPPKFQGKDCVKDENNEVISYLMKQWENQKKENSLMKVKDENNEVISYLMEQWENQKKENSLMKDMLKDVLDECKKLSVLYSDLKADMQHLKGQRRFIFSENTKNPNQQNRRPRRKVTAENLLSLPKSKSVENLFKTSQGDDF